MFSKGRKASILVGFQRLLIMPQLGKYVSLVSQLKTHLTSPDSFFAVVLSSGQLFQAQYTALTSLQYFNPTLPVFKCSRLSCHKFKVLDMLWILFNRFLICFWFYFFLLLLLEDINFQQGLLLDKAPLFAHDKVYQEQLDFYEESFYVSSIKYK